MKFVKLLKYVEHSYGGNPSFLIMMDDGKEYISNGCQFVENTVENVIKLVAEYDCESYITELLESGDADISKMRNGRRMFDGCPLTEWSVELPALEDGFEMFAYCQIEKRS